MESSKQLTALLLISMFFISSAAPIALDCVPCGDKPPHHHNKPPKSPKPPTGKPPTTHPPVVKPPKTHPPVVKPPVVRPPVVKPPITLPPIVRPPVVTPPIVKPPVVTPPITLPPVVTPPITLPPIVKPPITLPPVVNPPSTKPGTPCPPPPFVPAPAATCPIDALKLGACVDLLGGLIHIGLGDPVVNQCCPILAGLVELEAAVCLFACYLWQDSSSWLHLFYLSFQDPILGVGYVDESTDEIVEDVDLSKNLFVWSD
ncbi:unnamed protein product [Lactuca saligna]|uniref:Hydrophobic seed protein domain-containing protein n=1 Tax=Lactuca saligna TaxID=75948 RepID=A0AA35Z4K2_LACSI|nr:unnamed protein product [Lactuca saligna]